MNVNEEKVIALVLELKEVMEKEESLEKQFSSFDDFIKICQERKAFIEQEMKIVNTLKAEISFKDAVKLFQS